METNTYIELILKRFNHETNASEEAELQTWLNANPEHGEEYRDLERIWEESGRLLNGHSFDRAAAWKKITEKVTAQKNTPLIGVRPSRVLSWKKMLAAAAVVGVLLAAGWFFTRHTSSSIRVVSATDASRQMTLPDGSVVDLLKGAVLQYKEPFGSAAKEVELSGKAFFQVTHDAAHPLHITTTRAIVEDIGTSFLLTSDAAMDEVVVATGKVRLSDKNNPSNTLELMPGNRGALQEGRLALHTAAPANIMSWKTGVLDFKDEPLKQVADDLGSYYQIRIFLSSELSKEPGTITVNARFDHQPLEQVIDELRLMTGLSLERSRDSIFIFRR